MSIAVISRNFANLESVVAALATLTTEFYAVRKGSPTDMFGQPIAYGETVKLSFSIRKFNGTGWEILQTGDWLFNFADRSQATAAQAALEAQIIEHLPEYGFTYLPCYVLRIGFVA